ESQQRHQHPRHGLPSGLPQAPPPGVSMRNTSPGERRRAAFAGSGEPLRRFAPLLPSPPPAAPRGPCRRRSVSKVASIGVSASNSRITPSPPAHVPTPPLPRLNAYSRTRSGYSISSTSIGVLRVLDIPTCTPDGPGAPRLAPCPPPMVS